MNIKHEQLYNIALQSINEVYSDFSAPLQMVLESLLGLEEEISILKDAIETDIKETWSIDLEIDNE